MIHKHIFFPFFLAILFYCSNVYSQINTKNADGSYNQYGYRDWSQSQKNKAFQESSSKALSKNELYKPVSSSNKNSKFSIENSIQPAADALKNNTCLSGDCKNGYGVKQGVPMVEYRYEGNFKNGEYHGLGKIFDYQGFLLFDGSFENGYKVEGKLIEYRGMRLSGNGAVSYANDYLESVYVGGFRGKGKGFIARYDKDGYVESIYEGECDFSTQEGTGTMIKYSTGSLSEYYVGSWKSNKRSGQGVDSSGGGIYVGEFLDDKRNGEGVLFSSSFAGAAPMVKYAGNWKSGLRSGQGTEYDQDGKIKYEGAFADGYRHGAGKFYKPDGTTVEAVWEKGVNAELDPSSVPAARFILKEIDENFDNGNKNKWETDKYFHKLTKGAYTLSSGTTDLPGSLGFTAKDDWIFEATANRTKGLRKGMDFGIGWYGCKFLISEYNLVEFTYKDGKTSKGSFNMDYKVKKGKNKLQVIKKGTTIEAKLNGTTIYSGEAINLVSTSLHLIVGSGLEGEVEYTHVLFKFL